MTAFGLGVLVVGRMFEGGLLRVWKEKRLVMSRRGLRWKDDCGFGKNRGDPGVLSMGNRNTYLVSGEGHVNHPSKEGLGMDYKSLVVNWPPQTPPLQAS